MDQDTTGFSWPFLESMSTWTLWVGIVVAGVGGLLLGDALFAVAVLAGVLADVVIVRTTVHRGTRAEMTHAVMPSIAGLFVGVRLVIKAVILIVAYLAVDPAEFWGAVIGVVLFDTVLLTVGSVRAASTAFGTKGR